jgi:hypothetical protein
MAPEIEEAAIQSDSYIDALLAGHARQPIAWPALGSRPEVNVRHVIRLLEHGLPRFHPSFLFEERLAEQLRDAAGAMAAPSGSAGSVTWAVDRRLLMGGALASGVSLAGAAVLAWRRRHN